MLTSTFIETESVEKTSNLAVFGILSTHQVEIIKNGLDDKAKLTFFNTSPHRFLLPVLTQREKCPNTEFFLVRIFSYSD